MRYASVDYKQRICGAMNYISRNLERDLSLEEIAETASFSMFHFHRIFKAVVGETVAGFTRRLRLESAANRLVFDPREDITAVAAGCGFSSSQNFAKAFRQHFGMTPSEFRKSKIGNKNSKKENGHSFRPAYDSGVAIAEAARRRSRMIVKADVKEMPESEVAYVRAVGPYGKETCVSALWELRRWAGPRNYWGPGRTLAIYWDNPDVTPADKCRFDACAIVPKGTIPEGRVNIQTIGGGSYAACRFEITPDRIPQAWEDAFAWLCDSGYECRDTQCYEIYHTDVAERPEGKWVLDVCIPIKREN